MTWAGRPQPENMGESQHFRPNNDEYYYKGPELSVQEQKPSALGRLRSRFPFLYTKKGIALVIGVTLLVVGGGLAGLAALPRDGNGGDDVRPIADDAFFYGLSPEVHPSREFIYIGTGQSSQTDNL